MKKFKIDSIEIDVVDNGYVISTAYAPNTDNDENYEPYEHHKLVAYTAQDTLKLLKTVLEIADA